MSTNILPFPGLHRPIKSPFLPHFQIRNPNPRFPNPSSSFSAAASSSGAADEERRWLREEQRWIREEQRWLREESRWKSERESLLREIAALRNRPDAAGVVAKQQAVLAEHADVKEMVFEEVRVEEVVEARVAGDDVAVEVKERRMLKSGAEGEEVREMQEALQNLGFYSGEEEIEYSIFSSGTKRAVKTWQATLGVPEDGIMTSELLNVLFMEPETGNSTLEVNAEWKEDSSRDSVNGTAVISIPEIVETEQMSVKETGDGEDESSHHRVYLLGENRWEDPSRLTRRNTISGDKAVSFVNCLSCHGVGRVMCTECDGSGEPNIEPQFLEWIGEDTKCAYCEGAGFAACDACDGRGTPSS